MKHTATLVCRRAVQNRNPVAAALVAVLFAMLTACGTDFAEPQAVAAQSDTPVAQATVFRVIQVTPQPTPTPLPTAVGPNGEQQRPFPPEIDPSRTGRGLAADAVEAFWSEYLGDSRLIVEGKPIDLHVCANGNLIPGSPSTIVAAGTWGLRVSENGEWYEIIFGREFRRGRISGLLRLSRIGGSTVALGDGDISVVSVTDSDLCDQVEGF